MQMEKRNLDRKSAMNLSAIGFFAVAILLTIITMIMSTQVAEGGWAEFLRALGKLQDFIQSLENNWLIGLAILAVYALKSVAPIPFPFIMIMTGVMFEPATALFLNIVGFSITLSIVYWFGRRLDEGVALRKLKKYENVSEMLKHAGKTKLGVLFLIRLIPSVPINMASQFYGGIKFPYGRFMVASIAGYFIKLWTYSVIGGNIAQPFTWNFMAPVIILLIVSGVTVLITNIALEKRKGENKNGTAEFIEE